LTGLNRKVIAQTPLGIPRLRRRTVAAQQDAANAQDKAD
jgi:hypothetical protein